MAIEAVATNTSLCVLGATISGFARACVDLNIVARATGRLVDDIDVNAWYPFERLRQLEAIVVESYEDNGPILERVGIEMMMSWYFMGPGRQLVKCGLDFLRFQSGSQGYASVVRGPAEQVGAFALLDLDEHKRTALLHSSTPFNKHVERGVLIGGMSAPGDLDYVDVDNNKQPTRFTVAF